MKVLVFSDSHGRVSPMMDIIRLQRPDLILHLGDGAADVEMLYMEWPELKVVGVPGNCDGWTGRPLEQVIEVDGLRILLTHGHSYKVKAGLGGLIAGAKDLGVNAALFGHTHCPFCEEIAGIYYLNPGSVGSYCCANYAVIETDNGTMTCRLEQLK